MTAAQGCYRLTVIALALTLGAPASGAGQDDPRRVILFIGDGVGVGYWTAAAFARDRLAVKQFPVVGLVDVRSSSGRVPDSAASATSYATGVETYNGAVGVGRDSTAVDTVLEVAAERDMATGLVATSRITHATPASFAAHVPNRQLEWEIARQMANHDVTVMLGGGRAAFDGQIRPDSVDLLVSIKERYTYVETPEELQALNMRNVKALFGLFAPSHLPAAPARVPTLPQMTEAALAVLDEDPDGFFLMVEASQPDWRGHGNEPLPAITAEMLDFDRAIGEAVEYQRDHPETLIVVVGDHETGGLALQYDSTGTLGAAYTTGSHTATMVPLFAKGPGAEQFGGILSNARVGELLMEAVRR
ncbi:MAG: alkaline phosphatase [Gemmatimonadales bacterium]|nr:alkaline phosphatase [Gemmatimonadales bacterium]NIN50694.1 alkaline phosphatase [Gemmatimonadales bacterium]NIP08158.1 alkaline phosphatase [Gemmatimonadales bacterium]NIR01036.1 alkaline phosphatase [Gemmatimonadales bacterium]NIS65115.1 alkaline phosphatase [Gemmatimonadales bacterium]